MEVTDKRFFMKYNDAAGRKLKPMTAEFLKYLDEQSRDDEDVFR